MLSSEHTLIHLEDELPGARQWAERHDVPFIWVPEQLEVRVTLTQLATGEAFYLRGRFDSYRELPPVLTFTDANWAAAPLPQFFPGPGHSPYGASVFHSQSVICAPFNRLAYKEHHGPHANWGGPANWLTAGQAGEVKAHYLGDMLSVVYQHFLFSRGRMG